MLPFQEGWLKLPTYLSSWSQEQEKHPMPQSMKKLNPLGPVPSLPHDSYKADSYLFLQVSAGKKPGLDGHLY